MVEFIVGDRWAIENTVWADPTLSIMANIRDAGTQELFAFCGVVCPCATCHVDVDPDFADRLPPMQGDKKELLGSLQHRLPTSRFACRMRFNLPLDGLKVRIAPAE
jgi:2Fe-2S ferredoxin